MNRLLALTILSLCPVANADVVQSCLELKDYKEKITCIKGLDFADLGSSEARRAAKQFMTYLSKSTAAPDSAISLEFDWAAMDRELIFEGQEMDVAIAIGLALARLIQDKRETLEPTVSAFEKLVSQHSRLDTSWHRVGIGFSKILGQSPVFRRRVLQKASLDFEAFALGSLADLALTASDTEVPDDFVDRYLGILQRLHLLKIDALHDLNGATLLTSWLGGHHENQRVLEALSATIEFRKGQYLQSDHSTKFKEIFLNFAELIALHLNHYISDESWKQQAQKLLGRIRKFITDHNFPTDNLESILDTSTTTDELVDLEQSVEQAIAGWDPAVRALEVHILAYELARKSHTEKEINWAVSELSSKLLKADMDALLAHLTRKGELALVEKIRSRLTCTKGFRTEEPPSSIQS